jgi:hypothetical protein
MRQPRTNDLRGPCQVLAEGHVREGEALEHLAPDGAGHVIEVHVRRGHLARLGHPLVHQRLGAGLARASSTVRRVNGSSSSRGRMLRVGAGRALVRQRRDQLGQEVLAARLGVLGHEDQDLAACPVRAGVCASGRGGSSRAGCARVRAGALEQLDRAVVRGRVDGAQIEATRQALARASTAGGARGRARR